MAEMDKFIAKDGKQAAAMMVSSLEEGSKKTNFDPLMCAHNMIVSHILDIVGLQLMMPNEDGTDKCPLCFVRDDHAANCKKLDCSVTDFDGWIDCAVRDTKVEAIRLGLMTAPE
ncbi:MAG TPA: hypothetical protein VIE65_22505 [Methylobacter sp.]